MPETLCNTQTLQALLEEAYALTYRDSSLEVRRRYRRLICRLERRSQAACGTTGDGIKVRAEHAGRGHEPDQSGQTG